MDTHSVGGQDEVRSRFEGPDSNGTVKAEGVLHKKNN